MPFMDIEHWKETNTRKPWEKGHWGKVGQFCNRKQKSLTCPVQTVTGGTATYIRKCLKIQCSYDWAGQKVCSVWSDQKTHFSFSARILSNNVFAN